MVVLDTSGMGLLSVDTGECEVEDCVAHLASDVPSLCSSNQPRRCAHRPRPRPSGVGVDRLNANGLTPLEDKKRNAPTARSERSTPEPPLLQQAALQIRRGGSRPRFDEWHDVGRMDALGCKVSHDEQRGVVWIAQLDARRANAELEEWPDSDRHAASFADVPPLRADRLAAVRHYACVKELLTELLQPDAPLLSLMSSGLDGLTDDEYLWEPVPGCWSIRRRAELVDPKNMTWGDDEWGLDIVYPDPQPSPFTTIAWRMAHMTGSVLIAAAALRGERVASGHLDERWEDLQQLPLTAGEAVERWTAAIGRLRDHLDRVDEDGLRRVESHAWLAWAPPDPVWKQVEYFGYFEPASHGAEIRLLRDLYRVTHGGSSSLRPASSRS